MRFLKNNEIDFKKWDEAILNSCMPLVFAQSFYLNATCPGWLALVSEDYKTIMPVTAAKKLGVKYLMQPPFTPQLGIFGAYNEKVATDCFEILKKEYKFISIELNASNTIPLSETKNKRTYIIDLEKEYKYNSNTKRNIAKAVKLNLKVETVKGPEILTVSKKFLNPFLKNKLKIKPGQIKLFEQLLINSIEKKYLNTFIVKNQQEEILGLAHFISNGKHAVYLKGTNFDRDSGSMHFLMDHSINFFKEQRVKMFDFGGGQNNSLAQFYSGFGAGPLEYKMYKLNNLPKAIKWLKK